jgi:hypothetical protein
MRNFMFLSLMAVGALLFTGNILADDQAVADADCVTFVNCPRGLSTSHCSPVSFQFEAVNSRSEKPNRGIRYHLTSGPGTIDERSGLWTFDPRTIDVTEWGQRFKGMVAATQGHSRQADTCVFSVWVYNYAPRPFYLGSYYKDSIPVIAGRHNMIPVWWLDRDSCDVIQKAFSFVSLAPVGSIYIDDDPNATTIPDVGNLYFFPDMADAGKDFVIHLTAFDGIDSSSLDLHMYVQPQVVVPSAYTLRIEKKHFVLQGQFQDVSVFLEKASSDTITGGLSGFDILTGHDASALSLQVVFADSSSVYQQCSWEYFTYRYGAVDSIPMGYPSGYVRVLGLAETNNGPVHPTCTPKYVPVLPAKLFTMKFLISNDRTLECTSTPIRFYWRSCTDNVLVSWNGQRRHEVNRVFEFEGFTMSDTGVLIDPSLASLPGTSGLPLDTCLEGIPGFPAVKDVDFYHGGLDIVCADSIDSRGDINLNGIAFELSDCVMFRNYFMYGLSAFGQHVAGSMAASDVNKDGIPLTLADFVYMQHIVFGDASDVLPAAANDTAHLLLSDLLNLYFHQPGSDSLGALLVVFEGEVTPELFQQGVHMAYTFDSGQTRILIYSECGSSIYPIRPSDILGGIFDHRLISAEAATFSGAMIPVVSDLMSSADDPDDSPLPRSFALRQNYPNPFNAGTVISFDLPRAADVRMQILNVAGQLVHEVTRHCVAGTHQIEWDGSVNGRPAASGVYYYRITAGEFTSTKKMVLLK